MKFIFIVVFYSLSLIPTLASADSCKMLCNESFVDQTELKNACELGCNFSVTRMSFGALLSTEAAGLGIAKDMVESDSTDPCDDHTNTEAECPNPVGDQPIASTTTNPCDNPEMASSAICASDVGFMAHITWPHLQEMYQQNECFLAGECAITVYPDNDLQILESDYRKYYSNGVIQKNSIIYDPVVREVLVPAGSLIDSQGLSFTVPMK